jgi:hypothetical protein
MPYTPELRCELSEFAVTNWLSKYYMLSSISARVFPLRANRLFEARKNPHNGGLAFCCRVSHYFFQCLVLLPQCLGDSSDLRSYATLVGRHRCSTLALSRLWTRGVHPRLVLLDQTGLPLPHCFCPVVTHCLPLTVRLANFQFPARC